MKFFCSRGRGADFLFGSKCQTRLASPLFEIARVLVRFNHVASLIVNANQPCGLVRWVDLRNYDVAKARTRCSLFKEEEIGPRCSPAACPAGR